MRIKRTLQRLLISAAAISALTSGAVALTSTSATAAGTTCKTVYLDNGGYWWSAIRPKMWVPICYNGSRVWQNGNVSGGVDTIGYTVDGIDWRGTYNNGGSWLGAGMNYRATIYGGWASFTCFSRWTIDAWATKRASTGTARRLKLGGGRTPPPTQHKL